MKLVCLVWRRMIEGIEELGEARALLGGSCCILVFVLVDRSFSRCLFPIHWEILVCQPMLSTLK
jgi:hypothetical protein